MSDYRLGSGGSVIRASDGAVIPPDPGNRDYAAFQGWQAQGGTPDPAPAASAVPGQITNFQARAQMIADGNFDAVNKTIEGSGNATAIAAWDYANVFLRSSPFIAMLMGNTPYSTDALVDALFENASKIT